MSFKDGVIEIEEPEIKIPKPKIAEELTLLPDTEGQVTVHGFSKTEAIGQNLLGFGAPLF
ncbi:MAG: hypothetical protein IPG89_01990 [Bacteroidetes bacterium]|nr:hypothetical protein [Bacteroidota bacterium]